MKKLTAFLATILSFVVCLTGVNPALAQQTTQEPPSRGITTLYITPEQQNAGVDVYQNILNYDVAIPIRPTEEMIKTLPDDEGDFRAFYPKMLEMIRLKNGTNGSFTQGWFDFQGATAITPGTNTLFTINAPIAPKNSRIYSVVAGLPANQCPVEIKSTAIYFFKNVEGAEKKAKDLAAQNYLVYVSPVDSLTVDAFSKVFYENGKKKANPNCFLVSGATEKITVDFREISDLLPPQLQQLARKPSEQDRFPQPPFEFRPRVGQFIYLVNARKSLNI